MKWFDRMTVWKKLMLAFAIVIAFGVVVGATGLMTLSSMHGITEAICDRDMDGLYWMEEANRNKIDTDLAAANLGYADDAGRQRLKQDILASLATMHESFDHYRLTVTDDQNSELLDEVLKKSAAWEAIVHQQIGLEPVPAGVDNAELVRRAIAASVAMRERIVAALDARRKEAKDAQNQATAGYVRMRVVMSVLVLASIVAGTLLAWLIARRLTRQLGGEPDYAADIANRIAGGDLAVRVNTRAGDQTSLLFALGNM
ncbi:MAG TPA: MCP four helix bundle domain-containing protein, partial [Paraburkholderia sp.]|nr:MCP four helix bundle domain-containing protein [Paraburkholderia sp.]